MIKNICIIDGHPDPGEERYIHAVCNAYNAGAVESGHKTTQISIADLDLQPLRTVDDFSSAPSEQIQYQREKLANADHVMLAFPLWLGGMPAATRAFFEQAARESFFLADSDSSSRWPLKMMRGKSARVIVTMGMPAFAYRLIFRSAALSAVEKGLLGISGFKPVKHSIYGGVDATSAEQRQRWLDDIAALGRAAR